MFGVLFYYLMHNNWIWTEWQEMIWTSNDNQMEWETIKTVSMTVNLWAYIFCWSHWNWNRRIFIDVAIKSDRINIFYQRIFNEYNRYVCAQTSNNSGEKQLISPDWWWTVKAIQLLEFDSYLIKSIRINLLVHVHRPYLSAYKLSNGTFQQNPFITVTTSNNRLNTRWLESLTFYR